MAVSTYAQDRCDYRIGGLKPLVYLMPASKAKLRYTVDDGTCHLRSVSCDTIYMIEGSSAKYTENASRDTRYGFSGTFTLAINEAKGETWQMVLDEIADRMWFVVFEDNSGTQYIQTVEYPPEYSYTYTFNNTSSNSHQCEITFKSEGNFPSMMLTSRLIATAYPVYKRCSYIRGRVKDVRMCPQRFCSILREPGKQFSSINTFGGETFVLVETDRDSFQFRQSYSDGKYSERIQFTIPLSDYKFYWHYGLEEFTSNRYAVTFSTDMGNTIATGFEFGYVPSYTIETSEDKAEPNTITITLDHQGSESLMWSSDEKPAYIDDGSTAWTRVSGTVLDPITGEYLSTTACQGTIGVYTLVQMTTPTGQPIPRFMCLEGYEAYYGNLEIVGTYTIEDNPFSFSLTFDSNDCKSAACAFIDFPADAVFSMNGETKRFTVRAKCDWTVTGIPDWITIDKTSGSANESVLVTITATADPGQDEKHATLTWTAGGASAQTDVTMVKGTSWLVPTGFNIDAHGGQTLVSYAQGMTADRIGVTSLPAGVTFRATTTSIEWTVLYPNESDSVSNTYTIGIMNLDTLEESTVRIVQDHLYVTWKEDEGYICDGQAGYKKERKFIAYTYGGTETATDEYRKGDKIADRYEPCVVVYRQWRDTGEVACVGDNKCRVMALWTSEDNINWTDTGQRQAGEAVEVQSPDCNPDYKWEVSGETTCVDGNLLQVLMKTYQGVPTGETKLGEPIEIQSTECLDPSENWIKYTLSTGGVGWPESGWNSRPLLYFSSDGPVTVNWGDGTSQTFQNSSYSNQPAYRNLNATGRVNAGTTIMLSGPVTELCIAPYRTKTDGYPLTLTGIDVTHAPYLQSLMFNIGTGASYEKDVFRWGAHSLNLSENRSLTELVIINTSEDIDYFTWPDHSMLQRVQIVSDSGKHGSDNHYSVSAMTQASIQKILDSAPLVTSGLMMFCPNYTSLYSATDQASCGTDATAAEANGWLVDRCCGGESVEYRIVSDGGTECAADYTKWNTSKIQQSTDGGSTWTDTGKTVRTTVAEYNSEDCGYVNPRQEKWVITTEYGCDGLNSYWKESKYVSNDYGETWAEAVPNEYRLSDQIKMENDPACGADPDIEWQYRWVDMPGQTVCHEGDLCQKQKKQRSWDGVYWEDVYPEEYQAGAVIEKNAKVCDDSPATLYRWIKDGYICDGTVKMQNEKRQKSEDDGITWTDTGETRAITVIEYDSEDCDYGVEWVDTGDYVCREE